MGRHRVSWIALVAIGVLVVGAPVLAADVTISGPTTFAVADASDGTTDGVFNVAGNLLITSAGSITCNDPSPTPTGADACDITIVVTGKLLMEAGSAITADNTVDGGNAGNITITVGTDMTMCGPNGGQPGCLATGIPGALISAQKESGGATSIVNSVTITVGDKTKATGNFYMEGGVTTYGHETGATIDTTSTTGHAGNITVTAGKTYFAEPGSVVQAGAPLGGVTATAQGGKIFLVADCKLTSQGRVTSKGPDFGADLVHLESCDVLIEGLVESTGKGHVSGAPNSCDLVPDGLPGEVLRDHPAASTGCVEVWGNFIKIDSTPPWAGELNADIGDGGAEGTSWIDIFAFSDLTVIDGTGNDFERDNFGHAYFSTYAVHANAVDGSDNNPSVVTALVKSGPLTAGSDGTDGGGRAFEASSTMINDTGHGLHGLPNDPDPFEGIGSDGGTIDLEASGTVMLDTAWVNASGAFNSGTPPNGGHILVSAWGATSNLSWQSVSGDVRPNATGTILLNACGSITLGADFHGETPTQTHTCDATKPDIPVITAANAGPVFKQDLWALCGSSSVSGIKFNDLNGNHVRDLLPTPEPVLSGWEIKIWDETQTTLKGTTNTLADGSYSFTVPTGKYVVCETLQGGWTQTAPVAGVACTNGTIGFAVDLTSTTCTGTQVTGKDFGNNQLATKSGKKFNDADNSGSFTAGDTAIANWSINLYKLPANTLDQTVNTAADGTYSFTMAPGTYRVCEGTGPAGFVQTFPHAGNVHPGETIVNTCPGPNVWGYEFTVAGGDALTDDDFGNFLPASKSGMKFNDLNGNHVRDLLPTAEPGLGGWEIKLWNATQTVLVATTTTGINGAYSFPNLAAGSYVVCETPQVGWIQTAPQAGVACTNGTVGYAFALVAGQNETGNDFGNWQPKASKSGTKFNDLNDNHLRDAGEPGLLGWEITLWNDIQTLSLGTTTTDANGAYSFANLAPGTYVVCETPQAGWTQTFPRLVFNPGTVNCANGTIGYLFTLVAGQNETGNDFGNHTITCQKQTAIDIMNNAFPGNAGPDITVRTWLGETVQAAVDSATDLNGDHYVIIMVIAHADGSLGGSAVQKVVVSKDYTAVSASNYPFGLIGCSVTLTGGGSDPAVWVQDTAKGKSITINGHATTILVADLHGGNSAVGVEADGSNRYLRNEGAGGNGTGIKVLGNNNTVHNGAASSNFGVGLSIEGSFNYVTDTDAFGNTSHGVQVTGNSNQLLKIDAGDKGKGNSGDGLTVSGAGNLIQEVNAYANFGNGISASGAANTLNKNKSGDRGKGNGLAGFLVGGGSSLLQNTAIANSGDGFKLLTSGFSLKNNVSGNSGTGYNNLGCQYNFVVGGNTDSGGNKSKGASISGSGSPKIFRAGCK